MSTVTIIGTKQIFVQEENGNDTDNNYRSCGKRSVQHNKRLSEGEKKMRLIDADALCKTLKRRIAFRKEVVKNIENENQCDKEVLDIVNDMPTMDEVREDEYID